MIKSMTGFGRAQGELDHHNIEVEIRSTNHRFCDISVRLPRTLSSLELQVRNVVQKRISRGKINVAISWDDLNEDNVRLTLNQDTLLDYLQIVAQIREHIPVKEETEISSLFQIPDLITREVSEVDPDTIWPTVEQVVLAAIENLEDMRRREGETLAEDMRTRLQQIDQTISDIQAKSAEQIGEAHQKMKERIQQLIEDIEVDDERVAMEVAILADKLDITEECVRAKSHIQQFLIYLQDPQPAGRRLNFLLQEFNREFNTIASKANNADISQLTVTIKEALEQMREQVQNIE